MTYQKPDLFLVGAAQGLVLGNTANNQGLISDPPQEISNCFNDAVSRNSNARCEP